MVGGILRKVLSVAAGLLAALCCMAFMYEYLKVTQMHARHTFDGLHKHLFTSVGYEKFVIHMMILSGAVTLVFVVGFLLKSLFRLLLLLLAVLVAYFLFQ